MNENFPFEYDSSHGHYEALSCIPKADKDIGYLHFPEYARIFYELMERPFPEANPELLRFLDEARTISDFPEIHERLIKAFIKHNIHPPAGIENLPGWWGPTLATEIEESSWVEGTPKRTQDVYGWSDVLRHGAFLVIHFVNPLPPGTTHWDEMGAELMFLHQILEPGPFTAPARLKEFIP